MRRTVLAGALVVVLVAVLLVVGGTIRFRVASEPTPGDAYFLALRSGVLDGHVNQDGTACLWMEAGGQRTALYWPFRYTAGGWPLGIYDASGKRLASVGDQVWVGGGLGDPRQPILGCSGYREVWLAGPGDLRA